ncbi:MAG: hypothetical protein ACP5OV_00770 [Acidimicrobiales bacterium]
MTTPRRPADGLRGWSGRDPLLVALVAAALLEVVWIVYLGLTLPPHYRADHWAAAWVGLDTAEVVALLLAAWAAWRRRAVLALFTSSAGTMLLVDAWFDVTTARRGDALQSLVLALGGELPSALVLYWVTHRVLRHLNEQARARRDARALPTGFIDPRGGARGASPPGGAGTP